MGSFIPKDQNDGSNGPGSYDIKLEIDISSCFNWERLFVNALFVLNANSNWTNFVKAGSSPCSDWLQYIFYSCYIETDCSAVADCVFTIALRLPTWLIDWQWQLSWSRLRRFSTALYAASCSIIYICHHYKSHSNSPPLCDRSHLTQFHQRQFRSSTIWPQ